MGQYFDCNEIAQYPDSDQLRKLKSLFPELAVTGKLDLGWSSDAKYRLRGLDGRQYLLRMSESVSILRRSTQSDAMLFAKEAGLTVPEPFAMGLLDNGASYIVQTWLEGENLESCLPSLDAKSQYSLGLSAGTVLRTLHKPCALSTDVQYRMALCKLSRHISAYKSSGLRVSGEKEALLAIENGIHKLMRRPTTLRHGDFHPGNMIMCPDGTLGIIDFDRCDYGDPYEEFYKAEMFARPLSIYFINGQLHSYFEGDPPADFWETLSVYLADLLLYSPVWAIPFGQAEIDGMLQRGSMVLEDFSGFSSSKPSWYCSPKRSD